MAYGRKISGGKYHKQKKKTKDNLPGIERKVKLRTEKQKTLRTMGGNKKNVLLSTQEANIINPETKKATKAKIKNVLETPSNRFFARQNLLLKSAIIETELGKARITNRPSQEGMVQAVLIKE
ncbi:30S ribosomal protein S8e [Candidatus Pacearchaeota archaeon]|nr:30S ribosomal protein S8e [Candidatus Pacearchaeota archaeon]|tara:strand:+ start:401 stop:769 length:369 start_codon:yes stop_codon:yes gene_type:complete